MKRLSIKIRCLLMGMVFICLFVGCQSSWPTSPAATPLPTENISIDQTPTGQLITTATSIAAETSFTPSAEFTTLKAILHNPCLEVAPQVSPGLEFPGMVLAQKGLVLSRINPSNGMRVDIPYYAEPSNEGSNRFNARFVVSPDGKWLAYQDPAQNKVFIETTQTLTTAAGQKPIMWSQGKKSILRQWVSNDTLLILYWKSEGDSFITSLLLNPFTGEKREFSLEQFPGYLQTKDGGAVMATHYWVNGDLALDPTLQRVVYPTQDEIYKYNVLWDAGKTKPLARLRFYMELYNDPLWALDGSRFLIISYTPDNFVEWFQVSRGGEIRQVTHFDNFMKRGDYSLVIPSLSGDGRYLAFKLVYNDSNLAPKYLFLDLTLPGPHGFCIDAIPSGTEPAPVWSPDGKYVVISNTEATIGSLILVDVEKQKAYQIEKDVDAVGWIERP